MNWSLLIVELLTCFCSFTFYQLSINYFKFWPGHLTGHKFVFIEGFFALERFLSADSLLCFSVSWVHKMAILKWIKHSLILLYSWTKIPLFVLFKTCLSYGNILLKNSFSIHFNLLKFSVEHTKKMLSSFFKTFWWIQFLSTKKLKLFSSFARRHFFFLLHLVDLFHAIFAQSFLVEYEHSQKVWILCKYCLVYRAGSL